jgi:DNA methylase
MITPYYQRGPVTVFHGEASDVLPQLTERGHVIFDPPYSARVHAKSRAGARKMPLRDGNGRLSPCAISRKADLGFDHLSPELRSFLALQAARLASRWVLVFSDVEGATWWRLALTGVGLEFVRTGAWVKVQCTPQFTGDRPAVGFETVTIAHPKGRKRWNGGGKRGIWSVPIVLERGATGLLVAEPRLHPTQKPEQLMFSLVEDFTDPGELVYDFTAGACSTAIGCLRAPGGARRFVGVERDERWCEAAAKRLDAELSGSQYYAAQGGQIALFDDRH